MSTNNKPDPWDVIIRVPSEDGKKMQYGPAGFFALGKTEGDWSTNYDKQHGAGQYTDSKPGEFDRSLADYQNTYNGPYSEAKTGAHKEWVDSGARNRAFEENAEWYMHNFPHVKGEPVAEAREGHTPSPRSNSRHYAQLHGQPTTHQNSHSHTKPNEVRTAMSRRPGISNS